MAANVYTIPSSAPFADTLAAGLIRQLGEAPLALADTVIFLPTQRAQRTFGDAFARVLGGAALLPRFRALGDVDEDEFIFDQDLPDLPPAIAPMRRVLMLAAMVRGWHEPIHGPIGTAQSIALAEGLAAVMDEMETQGAELDALEHLVAGALAAHWDKVLAFLKLLRTHWPDILAEEGRIAPATRRNLALKALAAKLAAAEPKGRVIAAGSTGSIPATAELLKTIAHLPHGAVVLPGLDRELDEQSWSELGPTHPQFGLKQLLLRMEVRRADIADWDGVDALQRERVLREALRPAPTTDAWRTIAEAKDADRIAEGCRGIELQIAADPAEEAMAVALVLREALETPGATTALVTPDRTLARRVAAELQRWEIEIDDSAGRPLSHTTPGAFLCLLAEAADSGFAPVPLLALLKHPLATLGGDAAAFREKARELDRALRGVRPDAGLDGIRRRIALARRHRILSEEQASALEYWFGTLAKTLAPLERALAPRTISMDAALKAHLDAAEALAGADALWRAEAGEIAANFIKEFVEATENLPPIDGGAYAALFRKLAATKTVRLNRARHPRVAILGALEARLQRFDVVVLGGLNEGTWPRHPGADPWFSRPMRRTIGLEQPEFRIGQAAHDFSMLAAAPRVVLTRAQKVDGVPTVASRWIQRLTQLTTGLGLDTALAPARDYALLARALNDAGEPKPAKRPAPTPPVEARPDRASVTEIERWVRDPYAIYARRVLGLEILEPLDAAIGPMERGDIVHKVLERFVDETPGPLPADATLKLIEIARQVFAAEGVPKATMALWWPRFLNAADRFVNIERERRLAIAASHTEIYGECEVASGFKLYGYADRIDILTDGTAAIVDYKTGRPPSDDQIEVFLTPQLPLEAGILAAGGFENLDKLSASELLYIHVSGGRDPVEVKPVPANLSVPAIAKLKALVALFARPGTPYLSRPHARFARESGDFDHLARVKEWSLSGWEPEE